MNIYWISIIPVLLSYYWILNKTSIYLLYLVFIIIPLLEILLPLPIDLLNARKKTSTDNLLLHLWYPLEVGMFLLFVLTRQFSAQDVMCMSLMMALGINVAHELIHKPQDNHRWTGRRLLEFTAYGFWETQHLLYHHKNVGWPNDPATAPKGMSVYEFVPRCIAGTVKQAYLHDSNNFLKSLHKTFIINFAIFLFLGKQAAFFHFKSCIVSIIFLEMINYLEHYGLVRKPDEKVYESHSWDAPYYWSSLLLFKLTFHSDHHLNAWKSYPELKIRDFSPKMPFSYPVMLLLSLVPPLFFRSMKV